MILKTSFYWRIFTRSCHHPFLPDILSASCRWPPDFANLAALLSCHEERLLEEVIANAEQKVSEGKPLSQELKASPLIPSIVPRMLAIAEETGKTAFMLQNIANICEENLEKRLQQFTAFLQPALLLLLGLSSALFCFRS